VQAPVSRVLSDFGRRLVDLRRERGWTQQEAAENLGWPVRDYRAAELGDRNLRISTLVDVSVAFDVPIAELFARPLFHDVRRPGRPPRTPAPAVNVAATPIPARGRRGTAPKRKPR